MSHRSYQSFYPCGNKLLQKKWDDTTFESHRTRVKTAKPMVDTKAPQNRGHVQVKLKKKQIQKERNDTIDRDNLLLLQKMQQTMTAGSGVLEDKHSYTHHSLNAEQRRRESEKIATENQALLQRITTVEPHYRSKDWLRDWEKHLKKVEQITLHPERLETFPGHVAKARSKSFSSYSEDQELSFPSTTTDSVEGRKMSTDSQVSPASMGESTNNEELFEK